MLEDTKNISGWVKLMAWVLTAIIAFSIWALAVLLVGCDNEKPETPNDVVFEIDPNSELVRSLNLLYDPNFYSTYKIVSLQFNYPDVNSLNEAASALRSYFRPGGFDEMVKTTGWQKFILPRFERLKQAHQHQLMNAKELPDFIRAQESIKAVDMLTQDIDICLKEGREAAETLAKEKTE